MMMTPDFLFSKPQDERVDFDEKDLILLIPYGLSLTSGAERPFLILKDQAGDDTLPVGINQLEAGATLTQSGGTGLPVSLHKFSESLLESLDIKLERCVFVEIKGVHQYVRIYMAGHPQYQSLKFRADEVMSLCIQLKIPIYATRSFISRSKLMAAEVTGIAQGLARNPLATVKNHQYLM
ncbi:MAG: bifunctional nuclease family protein [Bdellovibrionaceae bacterium]|nr:bifunctional nuclease family protein [Bdellovibrio sp.]